MAPICSTTRTVCPNLRSGFGRALYSFRVTRGSKVGKINKASCHSILVSESLTHEWQRVHRLEIGKISFFSKEWARIVSKSSNILVTISYTQYRNWSRIVGAPCKYRIAQIPETIWNVTNTPSIRYDVSYSRDFMWQRGGKFRAN